MNLPTRQQLVGIVRNATALSSADQAFRNLPPFDPKSDGTPVTDLDHEIQMLIFKKLGEYELHLIGEEGAKMNSNARFAAAVDPLDGTDAFIRGIPTSACAVTILEKRAVGWWPIIAVINELHIGGTTWSATEHGSTYSTTGFGTKESVCAVSSVSPPHRITISTWPGVRFNLEQVVERLDYGEFQNQAFGSIALGGGLIASGGTQATVFAGTSALETVAMSLIVRGAGGVATDITGKALDGFELGTNDRDGQPDFLLPKGAIMASNYSIASRLSCLILN